MKPILFHIGSIAVPAFFVMVTIGALTATFLAAHLAKKEGRKEVVMLDFGIIAMTIGIIGAKIFHIIVEDPHYYLANPMRVFYFWQGGFVSVGAFIFTIAGWFTYLHIKKLERWPYLDLISQTVPIAIFFTRIGCLLAGCCYGRPTDSWCGITFPRSSQAWISYSGAALYPVQIINMINAAVLLLILWLVHKYRTFYGQVSATLMMYYGASRFFIEFLRSGEQRNMFFGGTVPAAQMVSVGFFLFGLGIWLVRRKHKIL